MKQDNIIFFMELSNSDINCINFLVFRLVRSIWKINFEGISKFIHKTTVLLKEKRTGILFTSSLFVVPLGHDSYRGEPRTLFILNQ